MKKLLTGIKKFTSISQLREKLKDPAYNVDTDLKKTLEERFYLLEQKEEESI
jgi:hypothetical protein